MNHICNLILYIDGNYPEYSKYPFTRKRYMEYMVLTIISIKRCSSTEAQFEATVEYCGQYMDEYSIYHISKKSM